MCPPNSFRIVFDIFHNIPDLAIENPAKHLYGMGADAFVALQAGDLRGADVMLLDEGVL